MQMTSMTLYYKPTCPYCRKVLEFMKGNDIQLEMKDVLEPENLEELKEINDGKTQVPCLVIGGHPMLESDAIISFLYEVIHG